MRRIVEETKEKQNITRDQLQQVLQERDPDRVQILKDAASRVRDEVYGKQIFIRGLIEVSNYCRNDCYYCGIRRGNRKALRYRLTETRILDCARRGYALGFRTFVLQGGEDPWFTTERVCALVKALKTQYPECAVTLSLGEMEHPDYQALYDAGADRYLLRHETADACHYSRLHPGGMSLLHRMECLRDLKTIGFQTGCGFMVGSPGQTPETLYKDLQFIRELQPQMVGIGPFIPQSETPFAREAPGSLEQTLRLLAIIRLMQPEVLLPATTALGTIHPGGRELGILAGANVVMPNLSPADAREKYRLYDNKLHTGVESAEGLEELKTRMRSIGYEIVTDRGDHRSLRKKLEESVRSPKTSA